MVQKLKAFFAELRELPASVTSSSLELRQVRSLAGASMLTAVGVILNQFTIFISQLLRISFTFLPIAVSGMLYGPVVTGSMGAVADILKYFTRNDGGAFFPGFTLSEFLIGFLYGLFFYRKRVTLPRVIAAKTTVMVVNNLILNPLWLSMLYGQAFTALVGARLLKNLVMLPVEIALLYVVLKKAEQLQLVRNRI